MPKQLVFEQEARNGLKAGIDVLAQAVMTTLGPKGRNVAIDKKWARRPLRTMGCRWRRKSSWKTPIRTWARSC